MVKSESGRSDLLACFLLVLATSGCTGTGADSSSRPPIAPTIRPSILLVTLDTTRADAMGPGAKGLETPSFDALTSRGRQFSRAYTTVPETLPSHSSMMTGLYPAGHGIHENARSLAAEHPVIAEKLQQAGYQTAAFVSSFVLAKRFGLARGFETYDDVEAPERSARETTDRVLAALEKESDRPRFFWVHYFDAHAPYRPPEPFRTRYARNPYLGEVAAVDEQLGRLVEAFERHAGGPAAILVVGDHGEGLGDHGESQHGNLLYESTMHVPLVLVGPGVSPGQDEEPVSSRRVFHTVLDLAGLDATLSLRGGDRSEVVLGEGMKPFLEYGWQPQVMAVDAGHKVISAGRNEVYDVSSDPGETRDLSAAVTPSRPVRTALQDYPLPAPGVARAPSALSEEDRKKLASLGYVSAGAAPVVRKDAPRPVDMAALFDAMEKASGLFVQEEYAKSIPLFERILTADGYNLDAVLRLATAHSALGHERQALALFERAQGIAPLSEDVKTYLALHLARGPRWEEAIPTLEKAVAETPDRLPVLEALARMRERQGRVPDALEIWHRIYELKRPTPSELLRLGRLAMDAEDTELAIRSFESARLSLGASFTFNLELGVLYLASRRFEEARTALDLVSPQHPAFAMALFKRAQVSVLLHEPDRAARIEAARRRADATTRELIAGERLFQNRSR